MNHSPVPGLSFSSCPRSGSAGSVSPGRWGPSPTPPGFRGTRPGAGAPLPHRLRLPLKPLRSGHRFLGSPSQGQAGWPTGGACESGSEAPGEGGGPAGLQDWLPGSKTGRSCQGFRVLGGKDPGRKELFRGAQAPGEAEPRPEGRRHRRRGGVLTPHEHPTRPAAGMWGRRWPEQKSGHQVLRWLFLTQTRRFGAEPEPQIRRGPPNRAGARQDPAREQTTRRAAGEERGLAGKRNRKRRWVGPVGGASLV